MAIKLLTAALVAALWLSWGMAAALVTDRAAAAGQLQATEAPTPTPTPGPIDSYQFPLDSGHSYTIQLVSTVGDIVIAGVLILIGAVGAVIIIYVEVRRWL